MFSAYKDKRGRKTFVARFKIDGKTQRKTIGYEGDQYAMTAKKAFLIKEEMKQKIRNGEYQVEPKSKTFDSVFEAYLESVTPIENEKTIENKRYNYKKHIEPYVAKLLISSLDTAFWQQIINRALTTNLAPTTADKIKNTIKKVYDYAISSQWATTPAPNFSRRFYLFASRTKT